MAGNNSSALALQDPLTAYLGYAAMPVKDPATRMAFGDGFRKSIQNKATQLTPGAIKYGGILALIDAASELGDRNDPFLANLAEGTGKGLGYWGGAAAGATAGTALLGPVGGLVGGGLGALLLGPAGKQLGGGIYDLISPEGRHEHALRKQRRQNELRLAAMEPVLQMMRAQQLQNELAQQRAATQSQMMNLIAPSSNLR